MKSLRIDLIAEDEQRSAAPISMRGIARIATIAVPLVVLLGVASTVVRFMALKNTERMREAEWLVVEPQSEEAKKLTAAMVTNRKILKLVNGWENSNLRWTDQLLALRESVPGEIQLVNLKVTQEIRAADGKTKRFCRLSIQGKARGTNAQDRVDGLRHSLADDEAFGTNLADVEVKEFRADPAKGAGKDDRVFQIASNYKPLVLE